MMGENSVDRAIRLQSFEDGRWELFVARRKELETAGLTKKLAYKQAASEFAPLSNTPVPHPTPAAIAATAPAEFKMPVPPPYGGVVTAPSHQPPGAAAPIQAAQPGPRALDDIPARLAKAAYRRESKWAEEVRWAVKNALIPWDDIDEADVPSAEAVTMLVSAKLDPDGFVRGPFSKLAPRQSDTGEKDGLDFDDSADEKILREFRQHAASAPV